MIKQFKNRKLQISIGAAVLLMASVALFLLLSDSGKKEVPRVAVPSRHPGFTFFGVGEKTVFSESIENAFKDRLGSGVLEEKGTIDLRTGHQGFLSRHFPAVSYTHLTLPTN